MQIHAIHINHLLSFDTFTWEDLDPHLNVIVGPNGAGKTNLFHALRAVRDALSVERVQTAARWAATGHRGTDADTITIALDLHFSTAWEQHLLCKFLAAALLNQQEIQQTVGSVVHLNADPDSVKRFAAWVHEHLHPEDISWLFRGRLIVTHAGRWGWQCWYESHPKAPRFQIDLSNGTLTGSAEHNAQTETQNSGPLFVVWRNSLTEQERTQLVNGLARATPEEDFPAPNFSRLPDWVSSQQGVALQIGDQMQIVDPATLATYRAFVSAAQLSPEPGKYIGIRLVFQRLLEQALVFTDNVRLPHQYAFTTKELLKQPLDLSSGEELARFLLRKKMGNSSDRDQYRAIQEMFHRMTSRRFDVVLAPENAERQQQEQPDTSLGLVTSSPWGDIPLEFSGAGFAEALYLSAVLAGSAGQVVLLDEPAPTLHPTMQAALLDELLAPAHHPGNDRSQVLVNTHTPLLVPPDAIERVSRFTLQKEQHTIRRALNDGTIDEDTLVDLRKLLRGNLAARALLFSRAVLLLEGETELGALPVWFSELARQDIALFEVGGKGNFVPPLKLLHHFMIPWAIIGDGDMLWDRKLERDSHGPQAHLRPVLAIDHKRLPPIPGTPGSKAQDFVQWRQALETHGIFTLASSANEGIPAEYWNRAKEKFGSNKVACGRFIAESCECPEKVAELMQKITSHLRNQGPGADTSHGG